MKKPKIVKTELGYEPAFWCDGWNYVASDGTVVDIPEGYYVEPGFALPSRREAQAKLDKDIQDDYNCRAAEQSYQSGYSYACGYRD